MAQDAGWSERHVALFGGILRSWGSWVLLHQLSLSPQEESWVEKMSLGPELCCLGGKAMCGNLKLFLLPSPMHPNSFFSFLSNGDVLEFLHWNLDFHKGSLING